MELIIPKLDTNTLDKWNDQANTQRSPTLDELLKFLDKRCNHLKERLSNLQQAVQYTQSPQKSTINKSTRASLTATNNKRSQTIVRAVLTCFYVKCVLSVNYI